MQVYTYAAAKAFEIPESWSNPDPSLPTPGLALGRQRPLGATAVANFDNSVNLHTFSHLLP